MQAPKLTLARADREETVVLESPELTIGRALDNTLVLTDIGTSLYHARIVHIRNRCYLEDLGSEHGTWVNGNLVSEYELKGGDQIRIGIYTLMFTVQDNTVDVRDHAAL